MHKHRILQPLEVIERWEAFAVVTPLEWKRGFLRPCSLRSTPSITPLLIITAEEETKGREEGGAEAASLQYAFYKIY